MAFFPVAAEMLEHCFEQFEHEFSNPAVADVCTFPQIEGVIPGCTAAAFFFLWAMKQPTDSRAFLWLEQVLEQPPKGALLARLHNLLVKIQSLRALEQCQPHQTPKSGV